MERVRPYIDVTLALLTAFVALYFRIPAVKREAFEKDYPRFASLMGIIAGIVPFLPVIASGVKGVITGQHPSPTALQNTPYDVPAAPWSESPSTDAEERR
jgi:hypothetical protein